MLKGYAERPGFQLVLKGNRSFDAAQIASGLAFLEGELELRDNRLYEPMTYITWASDIFPRTGGGWCDFTSHEFINYAGAGRNEFGIINGQTNAIKKVGVNIVKDLFPVFDLGYRMDVKYVDMMKGNQAGRSLDQMYDASVRFVYQNAINYATYLGFSEYNTTGLLNNPLVAQVFAETGASTHKTWATKTPFEIWNDLQTGCITAWQAGGQSAMAMPNQIILPSSQWSLLFQPMVIGGASVASSIFRYWQENNPAIGIGMPAPLIVSRDFAKGQGLPLTTGGAATDRAAFYVNREDQTLIDIPVPLQRVMTEPSASEACYISLYMGQLGIVKFLYVSSTASPGALYMDGI